MNTRDLTYIGRRTLQNGKIGYAYRADDDVRLYRHQLVLAPIGTLVRITLVDGDDSDGRYYSKGEHGPVILGFTETDELVKWEIADQAAYRAKADRDAARRASKNAQGLAYHINVLVEGSRTLSATERAAFARYVHDQIRSW